MTNEELETRILKLDKEVRWLFTKVYNPKAFPRVEFTPETFESLDEEIYEPGEAIDETTEDQGTTEVI